MNLILAQHVSMSKDYFWSLIQRVVKMPGSHLSPIQQWNKRLKCRSQKTVAIPGEVIFHSYQNSAVRVKAGMVHVANTKSMYAQWSDQWSTYFSFAILCVHGIVLASPWEASRMRGTFANAGLVSLVQTRKTSWKACPFFKLAMVWHRS